jgi:hypothetical protein
VAMHWCKAAPASSFISGFFCCNGDEKFLRQTACGITPGFCGMWRYDGGLLCFKGILWNFGSLPVLKLIFFIKICI